MGLAGAGFGAAYGLEDLLKQRFAEQIQRQRVALEQQRIMQEGQRLAMDDAYKHASLQSLEDERQAKADALHQRNVYTRLTSVPPGSPVSPDTAADAREAGFGELLKHEAGALPSVAIRGIAQATPQAPRITGLATTQNAGRPEQDVFTGTAAQQQAIQAQQDRQDQIAQARQDKLDAAAQAQRDRQENIRLAASLRPAPQPPLQLVTTTDANGNIVQSFVPKKEGVVGPPKPSQQVETQRQNARNVLNHVSEIEREAKEVDKLGLMGAVGGRWSKFMAGTIGASELGNLSPQQAELLQQFRSNVGLLKSGMAMVHGGARGGGSAMIMQRMDNLINADKMDLPLFLGATKSFRDWLTVYSGQQQPGTAGGGSSALDILNARRKPQ